MNDKIDGEKKDINNIENEKKVVPSVLDASDETVLIEKEIAKKELSQEIKDTIEQTPFEDPITRSFFDEWTEVNDSIHPVFIDREEWDEENFLMNEDEVENEQINKDIETKRNNIQTWAESKGLEEKLKDSNFKNKKYNILYLPKDLQLWEMIKVFSAVDQNTFNDPELIKRKGTEIIELGNKFENAGIYLAQRLDVVDKGKEMAQGMAEEFYNYGQALTTGKKDEPINIEQIQEQDLKPKETAQLDKWLLGEKQYKKRIESLKRKYNVTRKQDIPPEELEKERQHLMKVVFNGLQRKTKYFEDQNHPWVGDYGVYGKFQNKVGSKIKKAIEKPHEELLGSIFDRGMDTLINNLKIDKGLEEAGEKIKEAGERVIDAIGFDKLKAELDEVRESGDKKLISEKESLAIDKIQEELVRLNDQHMDNFFNIKKMALVDRANCVGAAILGSQLMDALGINNLLVHLPIHLSNIAVTSDNKVLWRNMRYRPGNQELKNNDITGVKVKDIVKYSKDHEKHDILTAFPKSERLQKDLPWLRKGQYCSIGIIHPKDARQTEIMKSFASFTLVAEQKKPAEARKMLLEAIEINPNTPDLLYQTAQTMYASRKNDKNYDSEQVISLCRRAIKLEPKSPHAYTTLYNTYLDLGDKISAKKVLEKIGKVGRQDYKKYHHYAQGLLFGFEDYEECLKAIENTEALLNLEDSEMESVTQQADIVRRQISWQKAYALGELKRYEEALEAANYAIEIGTSNATLYDVKGTAEIHAGLYEDAIESSEKQLELNPNAINSYIDMGHALFKLERYQEAKKAYEKFIPWGRKMEKQNAGHAEILKPIFERCERDLIEIEKKLI